MGAHAVGIQRVSQRAFGHTLQQRSDSPGRDSLPPDSRVSACADRRAVSPGAGRVWSAVTQTKPVLCALACAMAAPS